LPRNFPATARGTLSAQGRDVPTLEVNVAWFRLASCLPLIALAACSSPASTPPPAISNLTYSPNIVPANRLSIIQSRFDFTDSDSDGSAMELPVGRPDGTHAPTQSVAVPTAKGKAADSLKGAFEVQPAIAGRYTFEIWLVDAAGGSSNHLTGEIVA